MPETWVHLELRHLLYELLKGEFEGRATIGSDQFVYWDPTNPKRCLAPDVMIQLGGRDPGVPSWKVWERGAPHVAVEVVSSFGNRDRDWERKLEGYRQCGILEVLRFDPEHEAVPLRIWDHVDGDLVERELDGEKTHPSVLGLYWLVRRHDQYGFTLRLARDPDGHDLLLTPAEQARFLEQARQQAEQARQQAERARQQAEQRVAELEALLKQR